MASDRAVGLRIILGVGNEAVLGLGDLFTWAAADPKTTVVTSYIETMRDVEGIGRGLDALLAARKPVLICAPEGESEAALPLDHRPHRRAGGQHRAPRRVAPRARRRAGRGPGDDVRGGRAAVARDEAPHRRGGGGVAVGRGVHAVRRGRGRGRARRCRRSRRATKRALRKALPSFASQNNPLDVTGQAAVETGMFVDALTALAERPRCRARRVRRVPAAARRRDAVGGPGAAQGGRAAARDGGRRSPRCA